MSALASLNAQFDVFFADDAGNPALVEAAQINRARFVIGREPGEPEFQRADLATVCAVRLEVERLRRRLADATPCPLWHPAPHGDL